jgi:AcrR family transcriptional regulator
MPRSTAAEAQRTREAILERAVTRASIDGLEGLTIGRLADELGLSKAGVIGPFGSKEALQLAAFERAMQVFRAQVWDPVADLPAGRTRLAAVCERWLASLEEPAYPGGCFMSTASTEWDAREGALRDAIRHAQARWFGVLGREVETAVGAGELPRDTDPDQLVFELNAVAMGLNQALLLLRDPRAGDRARRAVARLLATQ